MGPTEIAMVAAGLVLVLFTFVDAITTTMVLSANAGPLTSRINKAVWRLLLLRHKNGATGPSHLVQIGGVLLLLLSVTVWLLMLWGGWLLVFAADARAVVDTSTGDPAGITDRTYFTGYTIATLGVGDFSPGTPWGQLLTPIAALSGLFLATLAITYLLSVVNAVVSRRQFAAYVHSLGRDPSDFLVSAWNGSAFDHALTLHLVTLTNDLTRLAEQHLAYPALHYFHARSRRVSVPAAVAWLTDAHLFLAHGVAPHARSSPALLLPFGAAIESYVNTVRASIVVSTPDAPPSPTTKSLRQAQVPLVDEASLRDAADDARDQRRVVNSLVNSAGWQW